MANALVSSSLEYRNSVFRSLSSFSVCQLHSIQNTLARIVTKCNRCTWASPVQEKANKLVNTLAYSILCRLNLSSEMNCTKIYCFDEGSGSQRIDGIIEA